MKDYLNAQEKDNFAFMMHLADHIFEVLPEWDKNLDVTEKKDLKTALTKIKKVCTSILTRINEKDRILTLRRVTHTRCLCVPKEEQERIVREYEAQKNKEACLVNLNMFYDIAEVACDATCNPCKCDDPGTCRYKKIYQEIELPLYDTKTPCPFMVSREDENGI